MNFTNISLFRCLLCKVWASGLLLLSALLPALPAAAGTESGMSSAQVSLSAGPTTPWVSIPAGARVTYIGIHGGTVPVSLLTDRDGTSMVTFVGQTGNDFLRILLRNGSEQVNTVSPALQEALAQVRDDSNAALRMPTARTTPPPASNATVLTAETAVGNIPVIYVTGKGFARMDQPGGQWLPFGLSEKPLQLEGQVVKPIGVTKIKKQRRFSLPKSLQSPT